MRNRVVWLAAALLIGFVASGPSQAQPITNLIPNGGFETGAMSPWGSYGAALATFTVVKDCVGATVPEGPIEGNYCLNVKVSGAGANRWDAAVQPSLASPPGAIFQKGKKYTLSLFLKSKTGTAQVFLAPELNQDPYNGYGTMAVTMTDKWVEYHTTTPVFAADVTPAHLTFHVAYTAQEFWIDDAKWYEGDYVPTVTKNKVGALSPTPDNKATDVPRDPTLSWKAGPFAKTHNVYLGASFDDVNTADLTKAVSKGQTGTTFKPASLLEYGKTYYWRVDEVNAAPSNAVFKGDVWSFTVEPYVYPITSVTATASSQDKSTTTPTNTVNSSGLTNDLHSTVSDAMWLSSMTGAQPTWIRYAFDKVYKLRELWVWNHNTEFEPLLGYGFKDVTLEVSTDGTAWTLLKDVQFAQATALNGYAHNTTVNLDGVMARYLRLTAKSNWSLVGFKQYGLSEVRFYYVPVEARAPQPGDYAAGVSVDAALDWRPGREAASHKVFFGTDKAAVAAGTATAKTVTDHGFTPGSLNFGTTYYWKVDEVNAVTYPGSVWAFTTQPYAVVDDFESYNDNIAAKTTIFDTWIDGYADGFKSSGSTVGNDPAPFAERTIIHGGKQALPMQYDNTKTPFYSEAERTFDTPQDWTTGGATHLSLWLLGSPAPFLEAANGDITMSAAGADIYNQTDEFRYAYKPLSGDGSITVRVDSVDNVNTWTKAGVLIRESLDPRVKSVHMIVTPTGRLEFQYRGNIGGNTTGISLDVGAIKLPYWVRLTRSGNTFTGEHSADGKTWQKLTVGADTSSTMLILPTTVYIGMAVTSHVAGVTAKAQFSNAKTTGNATGSWKVADVGVDHGGNGPGDVYLSVRDSAGKSATVTYPGGANVNGWTEWRIPQSDLTAAGVKMTAVKKVIIGVGDQASPKAGGTGKLYVDDIGFGKPIVRVGLPGEIVIEAESAASITAPMAIANDSLASGGKYIGTLTTQADSSTNPPATGIAKIPFTVAGGKYKVMLWVFIPTDNDSLWVRIADGTTQTANHASGWVRFNGIPLGEYWHSVLVHSNDDNNTVVEWTLAPGTHTLEIAYREAGAQVDTVVIQPVN